MPTDLPDLAALLPSWQLAMRAERKSPATIASYTEGVLAFLRWAQAAGVTPEITKTTVQAFTADLLDAGAQRPPPAPATWRCAGSRHGSPRRANSTPILCSGSNRRSSTKKSSTR